MVNHRSPSLDRTFSALADPTRRAMLEMLARHECSVTELAQPFNISLPAISRHIRVLEDAGLLVRQKDGRVHRCSVNTLPLHRAGAWLERYRAFWEERFDSLEQYLKRDRTR